MSEAIVRYEPRLPQGAVNGHRLSALFRKGRLTRTIK